MQILPKLNTKAQKEKFRKYAIVFLIIALVMWLLTSREFVDKTLGRLLALLGKPKEVVDDVVTKVSDMASNLLNFTFGLAIVMVGVLTAPVSATVAAVIVLFGIAFAFKNAIRAFIQPMIDKRKAEMIKEGTNPNIKLG